jgi:hypothetical protein
VSDHYQALFHHVRHPLFHYVVANNNIAPNGLPQAWQPEPVRIDSERIEGAAMVGADVVSEENRYHHDPEKLAGTLIKVYYQRRPLEQAAPQLGEAPERQEATVF